MNQLEYYFGKRRPSKSLQRPILAPRKLAVILDGLRPAFYPCTTLSPAR
ncbi:MAG TPA: hypothetical protein VKE94_01360 [Gemmataceae bacterium]|nr:hypothetical protein [Gemmataceae bacterium]